MDLLAKGIVTGVFGTLAMDLLNFLFARTGILVKIDVAMAVLKAMDMFLISRCTNSAVAQACESMNWWLPKNELVVW